MREDDAIWELNAMSEGNSDQEELHERADFILLQFVPKDVADAYIRARHDCGFWYA